MLYLQKNRQPKIILMDILRSGEGKQAAHKNISDSVSCNDGNVQINPVSSASYIQPPATTNLCLSRYSIKELGRNLVWMALCNWACKSVFIHIKLFWLMVAVKILCYVQTFKSIVQMPLQIRQTAQLWPKLNDALAAGVGHLRALWDLTEGHPDCVVSPCLVAGT